jgi:hypothetical protein
MNQEKDQAYYEPYHGESVENALEEEFQVSALIC